jgi:hypothetical protein
MPNPLNSQQQNKKELTDYSKSVSSFDMSDTILILQMLPKRCHSSRPIAVNPLI